MKLSILLALTALFVFVNGFKNPALFFIGYLWTSVLYPTAFANTFVPLSQIFAIFAVLGYGFIGKTEKAQFPTVFYFAILFSIWVTVTTFGAERPYEAWPKWQWAIQSVLITVAMPLFLRTRVQIETAFIAAFSAIAAHALTAGIKTIFGTGGYDRLGRLMMDNFWLGETSTLALVVILSIPMSYYIFSNSLAFERFRGLKFFRIIWVGYIIVAIECMIGTSARTGVIALVMLLTFGVRGLFRKILVILSAACIFYFAQPLISGRSLARFSTIGNYQQDSSATTRIAAWQWAMRYASNHPLGGGFGLFNGATVQFKTVDANGQVTTGTRIGTAAHSIYFEVLGEQGYPGILLYLAMMIMTLIGTLRISRLPKKGIEPQWYVAFSRSLFVSLTIFAVSASFVGIAFQPMLYLLLGFYCCVYRFVQNQRVLGPKFTAQPEPSGQLPNYARA